jgi:hypothetical protein
MSENTENMAEQKQRSEMGEAASSEQMVGAIASISTGQASENETETIGVIGKEIKGRHAYPPPFFPFQLIPIDSTAFTGVFGGRRWD